MNSPTLPEGQLTKTHRSPRKFVIKVENNAAAFSEIALSVANGLDIRTVPNHTYQMLLPYCFSVLRRMEKEGNLAAVRATEKSIVYMQNYLEGITSSYNLEESDQFQADPEDIDYNVSLAIDSKKVECVDPDLYNDVLHEVKRIGKDALSESEYTKADEATTVAKQLHELDDITTLELDCDAKAEKYELLLTKEQERYKQTEDKWNDVIAKLEEKRENELNNVSKNEENELKKFDESIDLESGWKPSPLYVQTQAIQNHMSIARRYTEAAEMRDKMKELEKQEKAEYAERVKRSYDLKRKDIVKKYKDQRNAINMKYDEKVFSQKALMKKELLAKERFISNIQNKINDQYKFIERTTSTPIAASRPASCRRDRVVERSMSRRLTPPASPSPSVRSQGLPLLKNESSDHFSQDQFRRRRRIGQLMFTRTPMYLSGPASPRRRGCVYD